MRTEDFYDFYGFLDFYEIKAAVYLSTNVFLSFFCHEAGNSCFHQAAALLLLSGWGVVWLTPLVSSWVWHVGSGGKMGFVLL